MNRILFASLFFIPSTALAAVKELPKYVFQLKAVEVKNTDTPLTKLLKERYNAAIEIANDEMVRIEAGQSTITALAEAIDLTVSAGLELLIEPKERLALLEESLHYAQQAEKIAAVRYDAGAVPRSELSKAKLIRANAEIRLLREKEAKRR
jgi:hypothetical protein